MAMPKNELTDELFQSILTLESVEECYMYFEDLCTIKEVQALAQRLSVAKSLRKGESYQKTVDQTGVSSATVCRVNRCLVYGTGGYEMVIGRLEKEKEQDK